MKLWGNKIRKQNRLNRTIPVREIGDLIRYRDGTYRMVLKVVDPLNVDLLGNAEKEKAVEALQGIFNALRPNQSIQILVTADPIELGEYLWELGGKLMKARQQGQTDKVDRLRAMIKYLENHQQNAYPIRNFYIVLESVSKKQADAEIELFDLSSYVLEKLEEAGVSAVRLDKEQISRVIYERLTPVTSMHTPFDPNMDLMAWRPPDIKDHNGHYLESDYQYTTFYSISYIPNERHAGWLDPILNQRAKMDISITLTVMPKDEMISYLNGKISEFQANKLGTKSESAKLYYDNKIESTKRMMKKIQPESENLLSVTFLMALHEDDPEKLKSACTRLENSVQGSEMRIKRVLYNGPNLLYYFIPIGYRNQEVEKRYHWPMYSELAGSMLPFNSSSLNFNTGIMRGINVRTGEPVILEPWDRSILFNRNQFMAGTSGSGKSIAMLIQIVREWYAGQVKRQFVIDVEREFHRIPVANRIVFAPGSTFCTNPFHIRSTILDSDVEGEDEENAQDYLPRKISQIESFFQWIYPEMNWKEKALLLRAIEDCYRDKGLYIRKPGEPKRNLKLPEEFPTLKDLDEKLKDNEEMQEFRLVLDKYVNGVYASMFDGQTNWSLDSEINVLDIYELEDAVKKPMMALLLNELWEEIKKDRSEKKILWVDELGLIADERNPQTMQFVHDIVKRIRKYSGGVTVATQNLADYLSSGKWGQAILNNAEFVHLLGLKDGDVKSLVEDLEMEFSQKELRILKKRKAKGHGILIVGGKRVELQTEFTPDEQKWLNIVDDNKKKQTTEKVIPMVR